MNINNKELESSIISTIKAISENNQINAEFSLNEINFLEINQESFVNKTINLPKINDKNTSKVRAFGDLAALYLKLHNNKIHQKNSSLNNLNNHWKNLFDNFEKFRLIKEGGKDFKGIASNLLPIIKSSLENISDYSFLPFLILENKELEFIKENYSKLLNQDLLKKIEDLAQMSDNQKAFSDKSLDLINFLQKDFDNSRKNNQTKTSSQKSQDQKIDESYNKGNDGKQENPDQKEIYSYIDEEKENIELNFSEKNKEQNSQSFISPSLSSNKNKIKFIPEYKIYSKKFDQIVNAKDLITKEELKDLRNQLDIKLNKLEKISKHLQSRLKRKLLAKKQIFYEFNKEEGLIDRKKISKIVTKPFEQNNYFIIKEDNYQNTILSILIDNSGSMRGAPIIMSAMAAEVITNIFESFGIKSEILGFTTIDWRGGKSRKLWEREGKPKNPGRLSDLRHIIYKNSNQSFTRSKNNLGLMLKDGILKENIDGEALLWASSRLKNCNEGRKILLIISDGTPVDDSTNSNNDYDILTDHLHQTIHKIEKHSKIEIAAIGIGHNVGDFYRNSITIKNIDELGNVMIDKICSIL